MAAEVQETDVLTQGLQQRSDGRFKQRILAFKVTHILLSIFFLWLTAIHVVGLFFFTKGFLLTRLVLENQSKCSVLPNGDPSFVTGGCWHPRQFEKAVVIVIDALRYDFAVPFQPSPENISPQHYHNNLHLLYQTAREHPENALLLPFIADPPTSTLQRLQGLTAGNLPTFIDISSSFAGSATEEDNLLVQLKKAGKNIVHLGDDTWHSLFPGYFDQNLTHAYDSFNVWDLHTVDNGIIEHIGPLLEAKQLAKWDVIFAHFLGVDHAGHRYGPDHPAMADKLQQMNKVLQNILNKINEQTLLIVMGDHGMDSKGDHGGESDEEVESTLWMYSKNPIFGRLDSSHKSPPLTAKERPVEQIDLVSTLSLLLGLPIPFNNLGSPIAEAFLGSGKPDWQNLATANLLAFDQIQRYQKEYTKSRALEVDSAQAELLEQLIAARNEGGSPQWRALCQTYQQWHKASVRMYRSLWANFDIVDMLMGAVLSLIGLSTLVVSYRSSGPTIADTLPIILRNIGLTSTFGAASGLLASFSIPSINTISGPMYGASLCGALYTLLSVLYQRPLYSILSMNFWSWLSFIFTISQAAGFASNSYTIHEDTILLFFLSTFGVLALCSSLRQASRSDRILGAYHSTLFILLARVASYSRLCREEQMPGCRSTFYASQTSSTSAPWQLLIPFTVAIFLPEIIKAFYKGTASYVGSSGFWIGFAFRVGLVFVAVYWSVDAADNGKWLADRFSDDTMKTIGMTIARCVFAVALPVGIGTFVWAKPCIDISILPAAPDAAPAGQEPRPQITILGYANSFGARYFLIVPTFVLMIIVLLPPMGQFSLAILTWQILSLLEILDTNHLTITSTTSSSIGPVVLAMLGSYYFFKTGHQAVLSSIQWPAAFIPFRTITYPFAPILIVLNSFGAQIICAIAVPLVVLWKRPISKHNGLSGIWSDIMKATLAHLAYYATIQVATMAWAGHLRRHLMLYRIFMPRFLMSSLVLLTIDIVVLLVSLGATRISAESVAEIFGY